MKNIFGHIANILVAFVCVVAGFAVPQACFAAGNGAAKEYSLGFHFESVGGKNSSFYYDIASTITKLTNEETGFKVVVKSFPSNEEVYEAFAKNRIDGGLLDSGGIMDIIEAGGDIRPWGTYVIGKKRKNSICVWHRKNEPVKSVSELEGKNLLMIPNSYFVYLQIRDHLMSSGIDKPVWKFFKSFTLVPNPNSYYMALAKGEGDVGWGGDESDAILKALQPGARAQISYGLCTEPVYNRGMIAMNGKTVKKEDFDKATVSLKNAIKNLDAYGKKYPEMQAPLQYAKMIKMKLIPASPDEYAYELDLYKKGKKAGWVDEARYFIKRLKEGQMGKEVVIRPDMDFCKKLCKGKKAECVVKCLE